MYFKKSNCRNSVFLPKTYHVINIGQGQRTLCGVCGYDYLDFPHLRRLERRHLLLEGNVAVNGQAYERRAWDVEFFDQLIKGEQII